MLVFPLLAAGIGLVLATLSLFLPPGQGSVAGEVNAAPSLPDGDTPPGEGNPGRARSTPGQAGVLRLVGLPLLASGLLASVLIGLDRPFVTALGVSLAVGLPVGLIAAYILGRTLSSKA